MVLEAVYLAHRKIGVLTLYLAAFRDGAYMLMTRDRAAYTTSEVVLLGLIAPMGAFFVIWMTGHFAVLLGRIGTLSAQKEQQILLMRSAMDRQLLLASLQKRVLQFQKTFAESTNCINFSAVALSAVTIASVWPEP